MKIINQTCYETKDLKSIFSKCLRAVRADGWSQYQLQLLDPKRMIVEMKHFNGTSFQSGAAAGRPVVSIWVPRVLNLNMPDLVYAAASTFIWGLERILGHNASNYPLSVARTRAAAGAWVLRVRIAKVKPELDPFRAVVKKAVTKSTEVKRERRYKQARMNLKRATTRLRLAQTLYDKWTKKVRRLEREREKAEQEAQS